MKFVMKNKSITINEMLNIFNKIIALSFLPNIDIILYNIVKIDNNNEYFIKYKIGEKKSFIIKNDKPFLLSQIIKV